MPEAWETFYFMVGSSAGALIGLLFVVVTLTGEIDPARATIAQRAFMSPTVFHFVTVLIISCAAVVAILPVAAMALAIAVPAVIGTLNSIAALVRLSGGKLTAPHWTDYVYYGALPTVCHLWLILVAWELWQGASFAPYGVALGAMALLLLGIRDAWDLATWLVYNKKG